MKIQKIGQRSIMFTSEFEDWDLNLHLIMGDTYNYLIDTGVGLESVEPIKEYLKDSSLPLIIINTHYHWDHIWGNGEFEDSIIIAHKLCHDIMVEQWDEMYDNNKGYAKNKVIKKLPTVVFEDSLYFPDDQIRIFHTPGHSDDGISIYDEKDKVLNAGDNIGDSMEYIVPNLESSHDDYLETLNKYSTLDFNHCISGHNGIVTKDVITLIINSL